MKGKSTKKRITIREHGADPVDIRVGEQVRRRRSLLGMSQTDLGDAMNVSFQQIQKYERGANRITAGKLWKLAGILEVGIGYFFETAESAGAERVPLAELDRNDDPMSRRETLELARALGRIEDSEAREQLRRLIHALGEEK